MFTFRQLYSFTLILSLWMISLHPFVEFSNAARAVDSIVTATPTPQASATPAPTQTPRPVAKETVKVSAPKTEGDMSLMLSAAMMGSCIGALTTNQTCTNGWDLGIAAISAAIYIAGEGQLRSEIKKQKAIIDQFTKQGYEYNKKGLTNDQRESIQKAIDVFTKLQQAAEKKAQYQQMAAMGFTISTIIALMAISSCLVLLVGAVACINALTCVANAPTKSTIDQMIARLYFPEQKFIQKKSANSFGSFFISDANAMLGDFFEPLGITGTLIGVITGYVLATKVWTRTIYMRVGGYIASAALAYKASADTKKQAEKLQDNITKLQAILMRFETNLDPIRLAHNAPVQTTNAGVQSTNTSTTATATNQNATTANEATCLKKNTDGTCQTFEQMTAGSQTQFAGLGGAINADIAALGSVYNSINGGNTSGGSSDSAVAAAHARLSGRAKKLDAIKDKLASKINDELKKSGQPTIDLKKLGEDHLASMTKAFNAEMTKAGVTSADLASLSPSISVGVDDKGKIVKSDANTEVTIPDMSLGGKIDPIKLEDDEALEAATDMYGSENEFAKLTPADGQTDVNEEQDRSLFNVVSERYIRSAYPKFLKKKEAVK